MLKCYFPLQMSTDSRQSPEQGLRASARAQGCRAGARARSLLNLGAAGQGGRLLSMPSGVALCSASCLVVAFSRVPGEGGGSRRPASAGISRTPPRRRWEMKLKQNNKNDSKIEPEKQHKKHTPHRLDVVVNQCPVRTTAT